VLRSTLDAEGLTGFFLDVYRPSPVVSPWNGGSGFKEEKNPSAVKALGTIETSTAERLASYRTAIAVGRRVYARAAASGWVDDKKHKAKIVEECRGWLPDEALPWLDTAILTAATETGPDLLPTPPLLGSGGNDGRLDFSVAFMGRLADVLGLAPPRSAKAAQRQAASRRSWLHAALFGRSGDGRSGDGDTAAPLVRESGGYFHPGAVGGVGASSSGTGDALVNPWAWVLMLEGALLFASAPARRLGSANGGRTSAPFTVHASPVGYASSAVSEANGSRGEIWAPLWSRPAGVAEISRLLGEGRAEWSGRQARNGLDLARAAASLGVDRGIDAFVRHALVVRNGLATLAVPAGRVPVARTARPEVRLTARLDPWLGRVSAAGADLPAAVRAGLGLVEEELFRLARGQDPAACLLDVLTAVARLEAAVGRSSTMRRAGVPPIGGLPAVEWMPRLLALDEPELRLAAAFASLRDPPPRAARPGNTRAGRSDPLRMRELLRPVHQPRRGRGWEWTGLPASVEGLDGQDITAVLAQVLILRGRRRPVPDVLSRSVAAAGGDLAGGDATADDGDVSDDSGNGATEGVEPIGPPAPGEPPAAKRATADTGAGSGTAFRAGASPRLDDVVDLLRGDLDDRRLARYLSALVLLDWDRVGDDLLSRHARRDGGSGPRAAALLPPAAALVLPLLSGRLIVWRGSAADPEVRARMAPQPGWPRRLAADQLAGLLPETAMRLRMERIAVTGADGDWAHAAEPGLGPRLAAAGLLRLTLSDLSRMLSRVAPRSSDKAGRTGDSHDSPSGQPPADASPDAATDAGRSGFEESS
jgi:CRISPR-associated protein Csx17